jgi:hypothetical protein
METDDILLTFQKTRGLRETSRECQSVPDSRPDQLMKWSALRSEEDLEIMVQEMETSACHIWAPTTEHLTSCFIIIFSSLASDW